MAHLTLTPAQRRTLRSQAHHLDAVVMVGQQGLGPAVLEEIDRALGAHGLIKIRTVEESRDQRQALLEQIADRMKAAAVQHIGKLLVLWRPPRQEPASPTVPDGAPRVVKLVTFSKSGNHRATVRKVTVRANERLSPGGLVKRKRVTRVSHKKRQPD